MQSYEAGSAYYFRGHTYSWIGRVVDQTVSDVVLEHAAYIGTDGRFSQFVAGDISAAEIEPVPDGQRVIIPRPSIADATEWPHKLPREVQ